MLEVADGVWAVTAGTFPSNSYICRADVPGGAVLIDAGLDPLPIDAAFGRLALTPAHLFCTHGHFDHVGSASYFQAKYGALVYLHGSDAKTAKTNNFLLMAMKLDARIALPDLTLVEDGAEIPLGDARARYRHAPGHTPGSCVVALGTNLFTGDTLFAHGVGLSKLAGEQPERLRDSIAAIWDTLDAFTVHPGHGPSAPGAAVKTGNRALRAFLGFQPHDEAHRTRHDL